MRIRSTIQALVSGAAVYLAVAMANGCEPTDTPPSGTGQAGAAGSGGSSASIMNPVPDAAAEPMSGSRLHAQYIVGADGSREFKGWYDTKRNEFCVWQTLADGNLHCAPLSATSVVEAFADDKCAIKNTYALVQSGNCALVPGYAFKAVAVACNVTRKIYAVGTYVADVYGPNSTGQCIPVSYGSSFEFYGTGPELSPDEFQVGALVTE